MTLVPLSHFFLGVAASRFRWRSDAQNTSSTFFISCLAMKIVFGFTWGIWRWRTSDQKTRVADLLANVPSLDGCINDMALLKAAGIERVREEGVEKGIPESVPLDLVSAERAKHQSSKHYRRHLWSSEVPPGSLCLIGDGVYVFTPAFCLLQVAMGVTKNFKGLVDQRLSVVIIIQLACELCGQYSLAENGDGFIERLPLTTTGEIARTMVAATGLHGAWVLRAAFPWILDNLRSPAEANLYLLLCLPAKWGGFGLPRPFSNYDLDVSRVRKGFFAYRQSCNVDLFWGEARLVVEYDSRRHHEDAGDQKVENDERRAAALRELGYVVVTVRHDDLYNAKRLRAKAEEMADALRMELPLATSEFIEINNLLRAMLLRHDRWV